MNRKALVLPLFLLVLAACARELSGPKPEVTGVEPALVCNELATTVTISGNGFSPTTADSLTEHPHLALPAISLIPSLTLSGDPAPADAPPLVIPKHLLTWSSRQSMTMELLPGLDPGVYDIRVENFNGNWTVLEDGLVVIPPPELRTVDPDLFCVAQGARTLTLSGGGFLRVGSDMPMVFFDDQGFAATSVGDCAPLPGPVPDAELCDTLVLELPQDALAPGAYDVQVLNPAPANCNSSENVTVAVVPPPALESVVPDLVCVEEGANALTLTGTGFLDVEGSLPTVSFNGRPFTADSLDNCMPVAGTLLQARTCTTLVVTLPQNSLTEGSYDVGVTNPDPAGCTSTEAVSIAVVESPDVTGGLQPDIICNAQGDDTVTLTGEGFLDVDGTLPTVTVGGQPLPAASVAGCTDVAGTTIPTRTCTTLTVDIPAGTLPEGALELTVTNPPPAACSSPAVMLYVLPPPDITWSQPAPPCTSDPTTLEISGTGFLVVDAVEPTVTVEGTVVTIIAMGGCADYAGPAETIQTCTAITVTIPAGLLGIGTYQVTVVNPDPPGCQDSFDSAIGLPPSIDSISPMRICETGGQITVNGSNFLDGAQVSVGGTDMDTTFISDTQLQADIPDGALAGGLYDVTVTNPDGCSATLEDALQIIELPLVYYVDPPVVYNGISTQVTIFASGIAGNVIDVSIRPTGQPGPVTSITFSFNPMRANRILAIIPQGTTPGRYDVIVSDDVGCVAELIDGLAVTDTLTLAIETMLPPFGWTNQDTPVVLYATDPVVPPDVQFTQTPRAYLNPSNAGPGTVASALESVAFVDPIRVNAVVPAGLPMGTYDLIAVNPDGAVGYLPNAFEVTEEAPPLVDNITPGSVINQPGENVDVEGSNFRNPTVEATCRDPGGGVTMVTGTVNASDPQNIDVTFDMSAVPAGSACVVRITNDDGTYFDYSAMSVTNPARNLSNFSAEAVMNTARRAPAATTGRPTRTARFLYALGGDDGTAAGALDTVESAPVDPFGDLGAWSLQPYTLPGPRTLAGSVQVGRFIYLVGGHDETSAVETVHRAEILRPQDAPDITDADIHLGEGTGLAGGVWYYRVSAAFPPADARNPGGESLASDPLVIQIPDMPERIHITLVWTGVPGASGYRIYRSPSADLTSGSELLIAEVGPAPLTYTDQGDTAVAEAPLPFGSLGAWAAMPSLGSARESAGVTAAHDPTDATIVHIYAIGGRDDTGTALASYEHMPLTINADGTHSVGTWSAGTNNLSAARWQIGAFLADHAHAAIVPAGDTWIYAGGGVASNGTSMVREVSAGQVQAGGDLGAFTDVAQMSPARAGYGYTLANSTLYAFGGQQAGASNGGVSALITGPPDLENWNSLSLTMNEPLYFTGSVTESAFIFLVGGFNGTAATASVEKTVW